MIILCYFKNNKKLWNIYKLLKVILMYTIKIIKKFKIKNSRMRYTLTIDLLYL